MKQQKKFTKQNGITLISLVITIVIMLILAGVAISIAVGDGSVTQYAENAAGQWNNKVAEENITMQNVLAHLDKIPGGTTPPETPPAEGSITLNKSSLTLEIVDGIKAEETLTATKQNLSGIITWTSSVPTVATVDNNGKVTTEGAGTTIITASCGEKSATCEVVVTATNKIKAIVLSDQILTKTGDTIPTLTLIPTIEPANATNKSVTWTSSNTSVATVDSNGVVTYIGIGTTTITCTAQDESGVSGTCTVTCQSQDTNSYQIANYTGNRTSVEMIYGNKTIAVNLTGISKITFEYRGWTSGQTLSTTPGGGCYVRVQNATASPNYIDLRSGGGYYDAVWNTATINVTSGSASSSLYFDCWANTAPSSLYVDIGLFVRNITLIP